VLSKILLTIGLGALGALSVLIFANARMRYNARTKRFIRGITEKQKTLLSAAGLYFVENYEHGQEGVFVEADELEAICRCLSVYVLTTIPSPNDPPEVILRACVRDPAELAGKQVRMFARIDEHRYPGATAAVANLLREIVLPAVRRNINFYDLDGGQQQPGEDDDFHIFVRASPEPPQTELLPDRLFDIPCIGPYENRYSGLKPSAKGVPLVDPVSGFTYGELCGRSLYLFYSALPNSPDKMLLLAKLLEHAAPNLNFDDQVAAVLAEIPSDDLPAVVDRQVKQYGFTGHRQELMLRLMREVFLPGVNANAHIIDCRGEFSRGLDGDSYQVLYNVRPANLPDGALPPTGNGIPLTMENGELVGELFGKTLCLYSDLLSHGTKADVAKFAQVLLRARRLMRTENAMNARDIAMSEFTRQCVELVRLAASSPPGAAKSAKAAIEQQLRAVQRSARTCEREFIDMLGIDGRELIGREYDNLRRIKKVKDVQVSDNELVVDTHMLYCTEPKSGVKYRIGEFKIHIPLAHGEIRFLNQTQTINGKHAPHVNTAGTACLGSTADLFPELIRKREFASVVNLAILFLESVNVDDSWGRTIAQWPRVL